jgi:hypothetical protein
MNQLAACSNAGGVKHSSVTTGCVYSQTGGAVEACHWLGHCFGDDFCKAARSVDFQLETQRRKGMASRFDVPSPFLPTRALRVSTHATLAKPVPPNVTPLCHCHPAAFSATPPRGCHGCKLYFVT